MSFDLPRWSADVCEEVDRFLHVALQLDWPAAFHAPLVWPVFGGGKRVRPLLTIAACEAVGGARSAAVPAGAAVELVHTYSLVHDDLPAMDDDDLRRGRPTVHKAWDEATAILVGDALQTEAFAVLAAAPLTAEARVQLVAELALAAGARGMVGGQAADIGIDGKVNDLPNLERLHAGKTGALIRAATVMGGISGGADAAALDALRRYGAAVGLAFQLADDVLDSEQDAGDDGPPSFVKLLGAEATLHRARALAEEACAAVADLPSPAALLALARYTVERTI
jgi:geranylgeranyl pyrophosphate synthase